MRFFGDWEAFWREGFDIESFGCEGLDIESLGANGDLEIVRALEAQESLEAEVSLGIEKGLKMKQGFLHLLTEAGAEYIAGEHRGGYAEGYEGSRGVSSFFARFFADFLHGGEYDIAAISKGAMGGVMSDGVMEALEFAYMRYEAHKRIGRVSLLFWGEDSIDFSSWESRLLDLLDYGVEMEIFITASLPRSEELAEFFRAFGVVYWFKPARLPESAI